jgi:hypothetical protein
MGLEYKLNHKCEQLQKSIADRDHESDLNIFALEHENENRNVWYAFHDGGIVLIIDYCPFCGKRLLPIHRKE